MNTLAEIYQVWSLLLDSIIQEERDGAANDLVLYLLDQGYELDDMRYQFDGDRHLMASVKFHSDEDPQQDEENSWDGDSGWENHHDDESDEW